MQELVIDEVEQVSGGLTYYYTYRGIVIFNGDEPMMPSPGPVIPEMA